jgi:NTE family protein
MKFENNKNINKNIEDEINKICINPNKNILVLCGGGIKGIYILGGLKYLEEQKILANINTFVGTSCGGWLALYLSIGYTIDELYKFVKIFDFTKSTDTNFDINYIFNNYSINTDNNIDIILDKTISLKNIDPNITLIDLYKKTKKKIILCTVCLDTKDCEYISYETYPELNIKTAIKMTLSVPLLFPPVKYNNKLYVDGGLLNNFPINIFKDNLENIIGINLHSEFLYVKDYNNIINYILKIMSIMFIPCIKKYDEEKYKNIVYNIKLDNTSKTFDFELTPERKKEMFLEGYNLFKNEYLKNL